MKLLVGFLAVSCWAQQTGTGNVGVVITPSNGGGVPTGAAGGGLGGTYANPTVRTDIAYCPDTSVSANTITCLVDSTKGAFAAYSAGETIDVLLANTVTGATTIAVNGLAAKAVTYNGTNALTSAIGWVAGSTGRLVYDGTRFVMEGIVSTGGACPGGSAGQVQFNVSAGVCGGDSNLTWDNTTKTLAVGTSLSVDAVYHHAGLNATQKLSALTSQGAASFTIASCTTTANSSRTLTGTGVGCAFLSQLGIGDQYELSGTAGRFCTVQVVTDNTHAVGDESWGDDCGDGTSQTITVYPSSFGLNADSGGRFLTTSRNGHVGFGLSDFFATGLPQVPQPNMWFLGTLLLEDHDTGENTNQTPRIGFNINGIKTATTDANLLEASYFELDINAAGTVNSAIASFAIVGVNDGHVLDGYAWDGVVRNFGGTFDEGAAYHAKDCFGTITLCAGFESEVSASPGWWAFYGKGAAPSHFGGVIDAVLYATTTKCANAASPAVCAAAAAGAVAIPTGITTVSLVVNTTAVTASSQIKLQADDSLTIAATTCNNTLATLVGGLAVTARTPGTSFTITYNGTIATNPLCVAYTILN